MSHRVTRPVFNFSGVVRCLQHLADSFVGATAPGWAYGANHFTKFGGSLQTGAGHFLLCLPDCDKTAFEIDLGPIEPLKLGAS